MCILQPCENPTEVGVWWRDDTKWGRYGSMQDAIICKGIFQGLTSVDLGTITSTVHPQGARYTADLQTMEQVAVSSGQRRPIQVIDSSAPQPSQISVPPPVALHAGSPRGNATARVHYRDASGQLREYDPDIAHALLQHALSGKQRSVIVEDKNSGKFFKFDLETMEQVVLEHTASGELVVSNEPPLKVIIVVPCDPETMEKLVNKAEGTMRRKILVMTVERLRSKEHLDATLPKRAYPRTVVSKTADLGTFPGHPAYEGFVSALEATLAGFHNGIESFIRLTIPGDDAEDSRVQMVFRPVGKKRSGSNSSIAFWSSMAAPIAAAHAVVYGSAVLQIVVYLVILPATVEVSKRRRLNPLEETEVLIDRQDHCLSLAQVHVR